MSPCMYFFDTIGGFIVSRGPKIGENDFIIHWRDCQSCLSLWSEWGQHFMMLLECGWFISLHLHPTHHISYHNLSLSSAEAVWLPEQSLLSSVQHLMPKVDVLKSFKSLDILYGSSCKMRLVLRALTFQTSPFFVLGSSILNLQLEILWDLF